MTPNKKKEETEAYDEHSIPLFKSWKGWYVFIMLVLAVLIALFYAFTLHFS
jgi:hypothetical protein